MFGQVCADVIEFLAAIYQEQDGRAVDAVACFRLRPLVAKKYRIISIVIPGSESSDS